MPPLQRTVEAADPTAPLASFPASLASWQDPRFLAPLGHVVDPDGPSGYADGLAVPVSPRFVSGGPELTVAALTVAPPPPKPQVQRAMAGTSSWSTAAEPSSAGEPALPAVDRAPTVETAPTGDTVWIGDADRLQAEPPGLQVTRDLGSVLPLISAPDPGIRASFPVVARAAPPSPSPILPVSASHPSDHAVQRSSTEDEIPIQTQDTSSTVDAQDPAAHSAPSVDAGSPAPDLVPGRSASGPAMGDFAASLVDQGLQAREPGAAQRPLPLVVSRTIGSPGGPPMVQTSPSQAPTPSATSDPASASVQRSVPDSDGPGFRRAGLGAPLVDPVHLQRSIGLQPSAPAEFQNTEPTSTPTLGVAPSAAQPHADEETSLLGPHEVSAEADPAVPLAVVTALPAAMTSANSTRPVPIATAPDRGLTSARDVSVSIQRSGTTDPANSGSPGSPTAASQWLGAAALDPGAPAARAVPQVLPPALQRSSDDEQTPWARTDVVRRTETAQRLSAGAAPELTPAAPPELTPAAPPARAASVHLGVAPLLGPSRQPGQSMQVASAGSSQPDAPPRTPSWQDTSSASVQR
ncbi:MAG: hypothetical protein H0T54_10355, partial [Geodermatophilaceae bacterium]|nr:hypothetical protein [Geodermatophilaceae bacterium]